MDNKELIGTYTLKNKDIPLIEFSIYRETVTLPNTTSNEYYLKIGMVNEDNRNLLPYALRNRLTNNSLSKWIQRRKAPKNRQFVDKIMSAITNDDNTYAYIDISHALSLNDALWITNNAADYKWQDFNLYHHPFDKVLAYVAFTGYSKKISGVVTSPEITSNGALKKCWSNRPDGIYLIKGDDFVKYSDGRSQATMEYYATQIASVMEFEHINYGLELFHHKDGKKEIVCTCKLFTSENEGYVTAYDFFRDKGIDMEDIDLTRASEQMKLANAFGFDKYSDIMVFDAIICNKDRHLANFGYIIDNNTGEYLRPAPIFDNGFSMLYGAAKQDMENLDEYIPSLSGKYISFDEQTRLFIQPKHIKNIRKLLNFHFKKHPKYNVADETLDKMNLFIQARAKRILDLYKQLPLLQENQDLKIKTKPS